MSRRLDALAVATLVLAGCGSWHPAGRPADLPAVVLEPATPEAKTHPPLSAEVLAARRAAGWRDEGRVRPEPDGDAYPVWKLHGQTGLDPLRELPAPPTPFGLQISIPKPIPGHVPDSVIMLPSLARFENLRHLRID